MYQHLRCHCGTFYHAGIRCQVAAQNCDAAGLGVRIVDGTDDLRILVDAILDVLANSPAGYSHAVQI